MLPAPITLFRMSTEHRPSRPTWGAMVLVTWLSLFNASFSQHYRATLPDGTTQTGQLQGQTADQLVFSTRQKPLRLNAIRRVEFPLGSPAFTAAGPARVFHLRGGETLTGELVQFTMEAVTLRAHGQQFSLPRRAILAIDQLAGERQLFYEDFNGDRLSTKWNTQGSCNPGEIQSRSALQIPPGGHCAYSLPKPIRAGRCSLAFFEPWPNPDSCSGGLKLQFKQENTTPSITIHLASKDKFYTVSHSPEFQLTVQRVPRKTGWNSVTVLFDANRFQVLIGPQLLAYGRPTGGVLESVRLFSESWKTSPVPEEKSPVCGFDDLQITESLSTEERPDSFALDSQSQVLLENGDVLFGELLAVDSRKIRLQGAFGEVSLPWGKVRRVMFGDKDFPAHPITSAKPLAGWQADIEFQRFVDHPAQPGDELTVTILGVDETQVKMQHSLLGQIQVPVGDIRFIEPRYRGTQFVLAPDMAHLGNQVRPTFRHKQPLGSSWHGEFQLEEVPEGPAFLRIQVSDLEPAGKETPLGSRYLSELRSGFLGTSVVLNGKSLGRLNDHISRKKTWDGRQSVRLQVPSNLLRKGKNTWRIEQTSRRDDPKEYDDCEIGPIWLEIETK